MNRYYGWYEDTGHTENIQRQVVYDFTQWWNKFQRPLMITEYGADTVPGLHTVSTVKPPISTSFRVTLRKSQWCPITHAYFLLYLYFFFKFTYALTNQCHISFIHALSSFLKNNSAPCISHLHTKALFSIKLKRYIQECCIRDWSLITGRGGGYKTGGGGT